MSSTSDTREEERDTSSTFRSQSPDIATLSSLSSGNRSSNIYTPLNTALSPSSQNRTIPEDKVISGGETSNVVEEKKKRVEKSKIVISKPSNNRTSRSSVRPFFCCGSEQSLISLIDGMELKESSSHVSSTSKTIEVHMSSDEEEICSSLLTPIRKVSNTSYTPATGKALPGGARRKKKDKHVNKKKFWSLRFRGRWHSRWRVPHNQRANSLRETSHQSMASGCSGTYGVAGPSNSNLHSPQPRRSISTASSSPILELAAVPDWNRLYPTEGIDHVRLRKRAEEMAFGIEIDANMLSRALRPNLGVSGSMIDVLRRRNRLSSANSDILPSPDSPIEDYSDFLMNSFMLQWQGARNVGGGSQESGGAFRNMPQIHTQIDFVHCLVPDLEDITACSFYWGVMDRYEAERLLDNKPEGTFLLRDSAQEEFIFSVSFRRYNRSLHARVEQWNHRFSFDAHDPAVFSAPSVCELMEHYKDSSRCMFFEPMLTRPLHRNFPFSLQHLSRAVICDQLEYDHIRLLPLPNSLKQFLQMYHYKQKVRVRHFDGPDSEVSFCRAGFV